MSLKVMMNEQQNLLREIHDVIEAFAYNEISSGIASQEYKRLLNSFDSLVPQFKTSSLNPLLALLYLHNAINFAKLTCIIDRELNPVIETLAGDVTLLRLVKKEYILLIDKGKTESIILHEDDDIRLMLYVLELNNPEGHLMVSISSSGFFDDSQFTSLCMLIDKYNREREKPRLPFAVDYFTQISHDLSSLLLREEKKQNGVIAVMIVFDSIERIFGHMGFESLRQISCKIASQLAEKGKGNPIVFVMSLNSYIVVYSVSKRNIDIEFSDILETSFDFDFYGINLPYRKSGAMLDGLQSVYTFFEELYLFENFNQKHSRSQ